MKLKYYLYQSNKSAQLFYKNFEEFVNNEESTNGSKNDKPNKNNNPKKKKKKKIKKYSELPLKVRKKIIQNMDHSGSHSNYYTRYGNSFGYYK